MCGQIVGVDFLQRFKLFQCVRIVILLVVGDAKFAPRIA